MSKLYQRYVSLKQQNPDKLYLFKSGIFYLFLEDDARKMSSLLQLKLTNLNESVLKCGFPVNSLNKYLTFIQNASYEIELIDSLYEDFSPTVFSHPELKNFIHELSHLDSNTLSIREAYSFLDTIQQKAKKLEKEMKF